MGFTIDRGGETHGGAAVRSNGPVLPVSRRELNDETAIVVHFKIASNDLKLRQDLTSQITEALKPVRLASGHTIVPIITGEDVTMTEHDANAFAAQIVPHVLKRLGIPH
jgi:hypothetical protein